MNKWKELEINNLPTDILTGDYEFEYDSDFWTRSTEDVMEILRKIQLPSFYYRYRKPEQKPLIVKSGETWVAHFEGVDYLWTDKIEPPKSMGKYLFWYLSTKDIIKMWKPFPEITLNDEIAKLRPMVIRDNEMEMLIGVIDDTPVTFTFIDYTIFQSISIKSIRLATAHELKEETFANKQ